MRTTDETNNETSKQIYEDEKKKDNGVNNDELFLRPPWKSEVKWHRTP